MATTIESVAVVAGSARRRSARKLADRAITTALDKAGVEPGDVDLLVNAGIYHDRLLGEPALAALLQEDVGANPEDPHGSGRGTFSFDVANGAAGPLSALEIVDGFFRSGTIRRAVVVAGDADPGRGIAPGFPFDPVGAAVVCGWQPGDAGLAGFRWRAAPDAPHRRAVVDLEGGRNRLVLHEDEAFTAAAAEVAAGVVTELLAEHGVEPAAVGAVAAAPFDQSFVDELARRGPFPDDRYVRPSPSPRFHTAGLIAAVDALDAGPPAGGDWIVLVGAGAGISAGAALLHR